MASGDFIVNPQGITEMVTVADTSRVDLHTTVDLPFSFTMENVTYLDTVNMDLANLEMPELLEKLTLEMTFNSRMPFQLNMSLYAYNSENEMIMDTLLANAALIKASFDDKPATTEVSLVIDGDRLDNVLHSDRLIISYQLDSEGRHVNLNVNQKLDLAMKVRAKYNGNIEFEN